MLQCSYDKNHCEAIQFSFRVDAQKSNDLSWIRTTRNIQDVVTHPKFVSTWSVVSCSLRNKKRFRHYVWTRLCCMGEHHYMINYKACSFVKSDCHILEMRYDAGVVYSRKLVEYPLTWCKWYSRQVLRNKDALTTALKFAKSPAEKLACRVWTTSLLIAWSCHLGRDGYLHPDWFLHWFVIC